MGFMLFFAILCQIIVRKEISKKVKIIIISFGIYFLIYTVFYNLNFTLLNVRYEIMETIHVISELLSLFGIVFPILLFALKNRNGILRNDIKSFSSTFIKLSLIIIIYRPLELFLFDADPFDSLVVYYLVVNVLILKYWIKSIKENKQSDQKMIDSSIEAIYAQYNISKREKEIISYIVKGLNNDEICETLFISKNTVKRHVYNIFKKMDVKTRLELVTFLNNNK